jgi:hypothetical protein
VTEEAELELREELLDELKLDELELLMEELEELREEELEGTLELLDELKLDELKLLLERLEELRDEELERELELDETMLEMLLELEERCLREREDAASTLCNGCNAAVIRDKAEMPIMSATEYLRFIGETEKRRELYSRYLHQTSTILVVLYGSLPPERRFHAVALDGAPVKGEFVGLDGADERGEDLPLGCRFENEGVSRLLNGVVVFEKGRGGCKRYHAVLQASV